MKQQLLDAVWSREVMVSLSMHKVFIDGHTKFYMAPYQKPTFTGLYTHFDSFCPSRFKSNLVFILLFHAFHICSRRADFWKEVSAIKQRLLLNGYPIPFLKDIIRNFHDCVIISPKALVPTVPRKKLFFCLPYIGKFSEHFKCDLLGVISDCYPQIDIQCVFKSYKVFNCFNFKDRTGIFKRSNVIYRINCLSCNAFYIGKTERRLGDRIKEHVGALHKPNLRSAAADHCLASGHDMDWANISVIDSDPIRSRLLAKETIAIKKLKPSLNNTESSILLKLVY